jgi:hypothetical protein
MSEEPVLPSGSNYPKEEASVCIPDEDCVPIYIRCASKALDILALSFLL